MAHDINYIIQKINWIKPNLCSFNALISRAPIRIVRLNIILLLRLLLFIPINAPKNTLNWVIISYRRSDLLKDFDAICDSLYPKYTRVTINPYKRLTLINLKVADLIFSWNEARKIILSISTHVKSTLLAKIFIFLSIMNGIKLIRFLESKKVCVNSLLSTMEMQTVENILVQYFRLSGANTFAYQHGFYRDTGDVVTSANTNPVNYLAAVCETALVWGDASKKVLKKYTSQIAVCVGKPILLGGRTESGNNTVAKNKKIVVILDSCQQLENNINIMQAICSSYSKEGMVRYIPHPDDKYDYSQLGAVITSHKHINQKMNILVGNNSSAILQYGRVGYDILLYSESNFNIYDEGMIPALINVLDIDELKFLEIDSNLAIDFWGHYIYHSGDDCLNLIANEVNSI